MSLLPMGSLIMCQEGQVPFILFDAQDTELTRGGRMWAASCPFLLPAPIPSYHSCFLAMVPCVCDGARNQSLATYGEATGHLIQDMDLDPLMHTKLEGVQALWTSRAAQSLDFQRM
uniref:Uncharacterized protein n=1 Tax=Eutreptiella gymnastica TaxID=73025 RepID=A0A7S1JB27_9EUGL